MNEKAIKKLLNPLPGSKIAAAKEFGVDLSLLARNLKLTPEQRIDEMLQAVADMEFFAAEAKKTMRKRAE